MKNMELLDTLLVVEPLIQAFERLGISYYIGGSVTRPILQFFKHL
jgi:hypothetical protein